MKPLFLSLLLLPVLGCQRPVQRFVPVGTDGARALDTKTGQICLTYDPPDYKPSAGAAAPCYEIYKSGK